MPDAPVWSVAGARSMSGRRPAAMDTAPRSGPSCAGVTCTATIRFALWATGHGFKDSYDDMNFTPPVLSKIAAHGDRDRSIPSRWRWSYLRRFRGRVGGSCRTVDTDRSSARSARRLSTSPRLPGWSMDRRERRMKPGRFLPVMLLLFVGSGCAALIYEVVWFQLLELVIGSSAVSMGVLLGTFMGGMCLGSLSDASRHVRPAASAAGLRRARDRHRHHRPCRALRHAARRPHLYRLGRHWRYRHSAAGVAAAACLLPPTMLMGATLPAIARWIEAVAARRRLARILSTAATPRAPSSAVCSPVTICCGCTTSPLRPMSRSPSTWWSPWSRWSWRRRAPHQAASIEDGPRRAGAGPGGASIGHRALRADGAGVRGAVDAHAVAALWRDGLHLLADSRGVPDRPWHRQQPGFGAGARSGTPRVALASCQLALAAAMAWTSYILTDSLPFWPINPSLTPDPWFQFQLDLARCLFAVLPGAILWGASFPLALASVAAKEPRPGPRGRGRLRRQHARRDRRLARREPAPGRVAGDATFAAVVDRALAPFRAWS